MQNDSNSIKPVITLDRVSKTYGNTPALKDISFTVAEGDFACIIGPSGGGKSTIMKIIAGIEEPTSGTVTRPEHISEVFQSYALLPWATALDNVMLPLTIAGLSNEAALEKSIHYLDMMGLKGFEGRFPRELSGGERQRVGIARALATESPVLLLDEPFSNLDPKITEELHQDLLKIWKQTNKTIVMVSHSIEEAVSLAERIILLKDYKVYTTFDITLPHPRHEQSESFIHDVMRVRREFFK